MRSLEENELDLEEMKVELLLLVARIEEIQRQRKGGKPTRRRTAAEAIDERLIHRRVKRH